MPAKLVIEDDGLAEIVLGGVTKTLDLYRVSNELVALGNAVQEQFPDEKDAARRQTTFYNELREYVARLGFDKPVSDFALDKFDVAIHNAANALGKTDAVEPTRAAPGSTAPAS